MDDLLLYLQNIYYWYDKNKAINKSYILHTYEKRIYELKIVLKHYFPLQADALYNT